MIPILAALAVCACGAAGAGENSEMTLWYGQPAKRWHGETLPLGNGSMGCMVFGGAEEERLQFNVDSLWTGDENMVGKEKGKSHNVSYLAEGMGFYQKFGDVRIALDGHKGAAEYKRRLDLSRAVHTVTCTMDGVKFTRRTFCSHPAGVAVMRLTASAPGKYSGRVVLEDAHEAKTVADGARLTAAGALKNELAFESQVLVVADGGEVDSKDGILSFKGCDALTVLLAAGTSYVMDPAKGWMDEPPHKKVTSRIDAAAAKDFEKLLREHVADHQALFGRLELDLGDTAPGQAALPTDKRIKAHGQGAEDPDLKEMLFQYGRYLLIASSRPGSLPANLQGVWNDSNRPPWHCDYHTNINVQMNYWLAEPSNLSECHLPLLNYFAAAAPLHREASRVYFGDAPGFTFQTVNNVFGGCGWRWNTVGSAWIAQHFWEHYAFSQDLEYLRETAYPYMKQVCRFWMHQLKEIPDPSARSGQATRLVVPNSWSPEQKHLPREDGVSYAQQLVWDLFQNTIEAMEALDTDSEFRTRLAEMQKRLVGPKIGRWGQLQEWMVDRDDPKDNHRHTSHLFAVYPGRQISPAKTPKFAKAAAVSLEARGQTGDARRSWTWPWRCAIWARLGEAEMADRMIDGLIQYNLLPNMIATHPPLQLDGSFGITAAMCEILVQSHAGRIHLLPALPPGWPAGNVTGLRARGGFEVDITWNKGRLTSARLRSKTGGKTRLQYGEEVREVDVPAGKDLTVKPEMF